MISFQLFGVTILLFAIGSLGSLLLNGHKKGARLYSGILGMVASAAGLSAAVYSFLSGPQVLVLSSPLPFGSFSMKLDGLAAFMIGLISVMGFAASLYSISYLEKYEHRALGVLGFFTNLFLTTLLLVVTASNGFFFLIFWETMTLASYFLVTFENEKTESAHAGYVYMVIAHVGTFLIMIAFFIFYLNVGSFNFLAFSQAQLPSWLRSLIFVLAFLGFGAKAGMVPLHIWMPSTYAAAPSHIAGLMAGVMKKTAIYGILRICVDCLGVSMLWWALLVLLFGLVSAVIGVIYALAEKDIKRMLAYSSVENVGLILMGVGTGMIGLAVNNQAVALLGFLAALYHCLNHAFFKGLLFFAAGSVENQANTRNLNGLGGLAKKMPWTAVAFFFGVLAVAAFPPMNGFVSEWFLYQALFKAADSQVFPIRVLAPLGAILLAFTGTLVAMCFVKAYGSIFSGPPRTSESSQASESSAGMVASMVFLAAGCIFLGLFSPAVSQGLVLVASSIRGVSVLPVATGVWIYPTNMIQALISPPLVLILILGTLLIPPLIIYLYGGFKAGRKTVADPWACGYGYSPEMSISANSFDQPVNSTFRSIYWLRTILDMPLEKITGWAKRIKEFAVMREAFVEHGVTEPIFHAVDYLGKRFQQLQMGDIRMYCLYIILTLAILLIVVFR